MRRALALFIFIVAFSLSAAQADGPLRKMLRQHMQERQAAQGIETTQLAGLSVAYWLPEATEPAPLVIFSHGFEGCKTQSVFLMRALAEHGYVVVAPDHADASCGPGGGLHKVQQGFGRPQNWTDQTYADRRDDIMNLYDALKDDKAWSARIDWKHVALAGHSLGGYTVLGLAGGWPSWKMPGISAVLALSPYATPYMETGSLAHLGVPVMYQGGTLDRGITPYIRKKDGAYDQTASPAYYVEFDQTTHFGWTDLKKDSQQEIVDYSLWFLDKELKGKDAPLEKQAGVTELWQK